MKLKEFSMFSQLTEDEINNVLKYAQIRKFRQGDIIIPRNTRFQFVYFILSGRILETAYTYAGKEVVFNALSQGDCFGLQCLIGNARSASDFVANANCEICAINSTMFGTLMKQNPTISSLVLSEFSKIIMRLSQRLYSMRALGVPQRTRAEILKYANDRPKLNVRFARISDVPTHEEIANTIFSHREAVTKEFCSLRRKGIIRGSAKQDLLVDLNSLKKLIEPICG